MKKRSFLVPFAATVAALLGFSGDAANASTTPTGTAATVQAAADQGDRLGDLVIERKTGASVVLAGHSSHVSHASHASHASHVSHQSSAY